MADTCVKSIRVNTDEWDEARAICESIHLPMSTAINLFLRQIVLRRGIPLELSLEEVKVHSVDELTESQEMVYVEPSDETILSEEEETVEMSDIKPFDPVRHEQFKNFVENSERKTVKPSVKEPPVSDNFSDIFGGVFS